MTSPRSKVKSTTDGADTPVTLAALAEAKRLPADFLRGLGVEDHPEGGVVIPYYERDGAEMFRRERGTPTCRRKGKRFCQPAGVKLATYGIWKIEEARRAKFLYLCEGESDTWTLWHKGLPALGLPGSNTAAVLEAEDLSGIEKMYLCPDSDQGGDSFVEGVQKRLAALRWQGELWTLSIEEKDVSDLHASDPDKFLARLEELTRGARGIAVDPPKERQKKQSARKGDGEDSDGDEDSKVEHLLRAAECAELWHDQRGDPFATVPVCDGKEPRPDAPPRHDSMPISSKAFERWLLHQYYLRTEGDVPSDEVKGRALNLLSARAGFEGPEYIPHVRVCHEEDAGGETIWLDLHDQCRRRVRITARGWEIVSDCPVRFLRTKALPLPEPVPGGTINRLRRFVNVSDADWPLVVAWLCQCLRPAGPLPGLNLFGEQGSAKTTTVKVLRRLIDPADPAVRREPKCEQDVFIAASRSYLLAYDNLSYLWPWLSDCLCVLSTEGGYGVRTLYTTAEETVFNVRRPVLLTGIEELAVRGDLADRYPTIRLLPIGDGQRLLERDFWRDFEQEWPHLFGALLDLVSAALRELPNVPEQPWPRMADFAHWSCAVERATGWEPGTFLNAYQSNRADSVVTALEAWLCWPELSRFVERNPSGWEGHWQELLNELALLAGEGKTKQRGWPRSARGLSGAMRRYTPALRGLDIHVEDAGRDEQGHLVRISGQPSMVPERCAGRADVHSAEKTRVETAAHLNGQDASRHAGRTATCSEETPDSLEFDESAARLDEMHISPAPTDGDGEDDARDF